MMRSLPRQRQLGMIIFVLALSAFTTAMEPKKGWTER